MSWGDIKFDLDQIAYALNPRFVHYDDRPDDVAYVILRMRDALVESIKECRLERRVWIIVSDVQQAEALSRELFASHARMPEPQVVDKKTGEKKS